MRRLLASALLAGTAALASPAAALPEVCTPTPAGVCVDVVCLKLCVLQIEADPYCSLDQPVPAPVAAACSRIDHQHHVITPDGIG